MMITKANLRLPDRFRIGSVSISATNVIEVVGLLGEAVEASVTGYVCVANVRTSMISQRRDDYCRIQNNSFLTIPDGMPLVWIGRCAGVTDSHRVTGYSLMEALFQERYTHFFLGDTEETLQELKRRLLQSYPNAKVCGMISPPFKEFDEEDLKGFAKEINALEPDFVWIGLGAPKQDYFSRQLVPHLSKGMVIGVGAAFRYFTGEYKRKSRFIQMIGLEGLFWRLFRGRISRAGAREGE